MDLNERGIYYPVLGICFGIQFMLGQSFEPSIDPTSRCIGMEHKLMPLNFTLNARESKLFQTMPEKLYKSLASENIAGHFHTAGVSMKHYNSLSDSESISLSQPLTTMIRAWSSFLRWNQGVTLSMDSNGTLRKHFS